MVSKCAIMSLIPCCENTPQCPLKPVIWPDAKKKSNFCLQQKFQNREFARLINPTTLSEAESPRQAWRRSITHHFPSFPKCLNANWTYKLRSVYLENQESLCAPNLLHLIYSPLAEPLNVKPCDLQLLMGTREVLLTTEARTHTEFFASISCPKNTVRTKEFTNQLQTWHKLSDDLRRWRNLTCLRRLVHCCL